MHYLIGAFCVIPTLSHSQFVHIRVSKRRLIRMTSLVQILTICLNPHDRFRGRVRCRSFL